MSAKNKPNELSFTRLYDAPVKLVWEAWTNPEQVALWWGPRGFTLTTHGKDLRPGGHWTYTMHSPDGTNFPNKTIYHEVEEYSRLVYDHGGNDDRPPLFRVTVTFQEVKGKTKMDMTMTFSTEAVAIEMEKFIRQANGYSTWDRLAEHLGERIEGKDCFVVNRSFQAPIQTVFEMWTKPEHLSRWAPTTGFTMKFFRAEVKEGGSTFYSMTNGKDVTLYATTRYLEIQPPSRLVYTQEFCDEKERVSRHPMAPVWPTTILSTITFSEESAEQTRVTVRWEIKGDATADERAAFHQAKVSMNMGWTGSLDKLEEILSK